MLTGYSALVVATSRRRKSELLPWVVPPLALVALFFSFMLVGDIEPKPWFAAPDVAQTFNVAYPFSGFFQPIDNGKLNTSQAGSAVPVKFTLGADRGMEIFAAGYPKSSPMSCLTSQPIDPLEETATPGESGLSYSPGGERYHYVWKTEKAWAGRAASSR